MKKTKIVNLFLLFRQFFRWIKHGGLLGKVPMHMGMLLTHRCNSHCIYCPIRLDLTEELTTADIKKIISGFAEKGVMTVGLSGGEVFLRGNDLFEIAQFCKKIGLFVSINTNGSLLKDFLPVLDYVDNIVFSLDGPPEIHDKQRGEGSFTQTIESIKLLKGRRLKVSTITVLTTLNFKYIDTIINLGNEHGFSCFFQPVTDCGKFLKIDQQLFLSEENLKSISETILKLKNKSPRTVINSRSFLKLLSYPVIEKKYNCRAGRFFVYLSPEGDVFPCHVDYYYFSPKNALKDGIDESLNNIRNLTCSKSCRISPIRELDLIGHLSPEPLINLLFQMIRKYIL